MIEVQFNISVKKGVKCSICKKQISEAIGVA